LQATGEQIIGSILECSNITVIPIRHPTADRYGDYLLAPPSGRTVLVRQAPGSVSICVNDGSCYPLISGVVHVKELRDSTQRQAALVMRLNNRYWLGMACLFHDRGTFRPICRCYVAGSPVQLVELGLKRAIQELGLDCELLPSGEEVAVWRAS
jgi:hypothetical protein